MLTLWLEMEVGGGGGCKRGRWKSFPCGFVFPRGSICYMYQSSNTSWFKFVSLVVCVCVLLACFVGAFLCFHVYFQEILKFSVPMIILPHISKMFWAIVFRSIYIQLECLLRKLWTLLIILLWNVYKHHTKYCWKTVCLIVYLF